MNNYGPHLAKRLLTNDIFKQEIICNLHINLKENYCFPELLLFCFIFKRLLNCLEIMIWARVPKDCELLIVYIYDSLTNLLQVLNIIHG